MPRYTEPEPNPSFLTRAGEYLAKNGPYRTIIKAAKSLYRRIVPLRVPTHPFDLRHGVDTSGLIAGTKLTTGHAHDSYNTAYWGTAPSLLKDAIEHWIPTVVATPFPLESYTFIDIGSGKGRVLMLASEYAFQRVIGVELSPRLVSIAEKNLAIWLASPRLCMDITVHNADALELPLADTPTLIYLFHPFDAPVVQIFLDRLHQRSLTRSTPIDFIYTNPQHANLFEATPNMYLLHIGEAPFTPEETAADAFKTLSQSYRIYRLAPALRQESVQAIRWKSAVMLRAH
jgi:SAM-dependent methyltransferase